MFIFMMAIQAVNASLSPFRFASEPPGRPLLTLDATDDFDDSIIVSDEASKDEEMIRPLTNLIRHLLCSLVPPLEAHGWVTPDTVEEGSKVILVCQTSSSFPPSNVTWHSEGEALGSGVVTRSQAAYGGTVTRSEMAKEVAAEDDGRSFTCEAENGLGVTVSNNVTVNVLRIMTTYV
ncbi:nephrin-like [Penaeus japonicus]|uniref:nephrin-like n=1 Tax=Penaeus japonicus TaxID=27405 RepID=UPI001C7108B6|nr:nephrin-like [Penaeus japonicus]